MDVSGWEKEHTSSDCNNSEDDNCNQEVDNNSGIKENTECKQVFNKAVYLKKRTSLARRLLNARKSVFVL